MCFDTSPNNSQSRGAQRKGSPYDMLSKHFLGENNILIFMSGSLVVIKEGRLTAGFGPKPEDIMVPARVKVTTIVKPGKWNS